MNIVFMGTPDFSVPALAALYDNGFDVKAVFSQPDKPKGRGYKLTPPPVKELALSKGTPVYQPLSLKKGDDAVSSLALLKEIAPDYIIVVAYGKILPPEILNLPKKACINIHASLLPKYRGAGPIQWSVLNGEKETGVTTMLMGEGIDTGDMLLSEATPIGENETADELHDRLSVMGAQLLIKTLNSFDSITPVKQNESESTHAPMLTKELCPIDFTESASEVHHKICGLSSWPCATTTIDGKRIKIYKSVIEDKDIPHNNPGEIIDKNKLIIACSIGSVRVIELQVDGSKRMKTADYLRGNPIK